MLEANVTSDEAKQQIIANLLEEMPTDSAVELDLPSECRVYDLPNPGSPITMRPMTFEDEKILVTSKKGTDPTNIILDRCCENIKVNDLLPMDKLYMLLKLREISYGDEYDSVLICPHCSGENPASIKLSELNVNPVPDDFKDPIEVKLPGINKTIKVRYPRVKDDPIFQDPENIFNQLWRFVVEIEGYTDKSIIAPVLEKLPLRDSKTILAAMRTEYGVETKVKVSCTHCKEVSVIDLPIDANFFDVN